MNERRLLLVDDDPSIREIATISLERVGDWTVTALGSGAEAVELCGSGETFDAIVLDVMMPGLDGPATLEWLRLDGLSKSTPVIFLTAKLQPVDPLRLESLGGAGVIAKPFDPMLLAAELDEILAAQPGGGERVKPELIAAWGRAKPAIENRLLAIERALRPPLDEKRLGAAVTAAHMLAGLLGTFGLRRGTQLAREIEVGLEQGPEDPGALFRLAVELRLAVESQPAVGRRSPVSH